ncbi:MAG: hypothetical protein K2R98_16100 [Gemmataceae bacterium]|nr:hypothetical protein [Gemmataceae bacterium]
MSGFRPEDASLDGDGPPEPFPVDRRVPGETSLLVELLTAGGLASFHGIVWLPFFIAMFAFVPRHKKFFADFGMKLPAAAELFIDLSDAMQEAWIVVPFLLGMALVLDAAVMYGLRRSPATRLLAWLWFMLVILLAQGMLLFTWLALWAPISELLEAFSR